MFDRYQELAQNALRGEAPTQAHAEWILDGADCELLPLLHAAYLPRKEHFGRSVKVHLLNNVQNGLCPEDCGYCSQSRDSKAPIREYPIKSESEILEEAKRAAEAGASRYCMVLSGRGPSLRRTQKLAQLIRQVKEQYPIEVCVSAGLLDEEKARILADAGLDRFNHNLNTSESHYPTICSTHEYQDRINTLTAAKKCGIQPCSGLIVGMGESSLDIIEVAFKLRELEVPSIPVNFLIPIEGNPVQRDGSLSPERSLRVLSLLRLVNPQAEIRAAGGREGHLRSMGALCLWPANSIFVEGYLTTRGDAVAATYRMIQEAGFEVEGNALWNEQSLEEKGSDFRLAETQENILKPEVARTS